MTILAAQVKRGGILFPLPPSRGVSPAAEELQEIIRNTLAILAASIAVQGTSETAIRELRRLQTSASKLNWDGYGSLPLDARSIEHAVKFLHALPTTAPTPDVSADPDGEVDLMWFVDPRRTLSVSVGRGGRLVYAALLGDTESYGTEWLANEIPQPILYNLSRVLEADL